MPGSTPRAPEVNGKSVEELENSSDSSDDLENSSDSNQKWEDANQIVGTQVKNMAVNSVVVNAEQSSSEDDSSEESMMTVNGSADENTATIATQNVNGSNDKLNENDSSLSQEQFVSNNKDDVDMLAQTNGDNDTRQSSNKSQDDSQEGFDRNKKDDVLEINSDSESDTRQDGNEEEESDSESEEDDDSSEESVSDDEGNKANNDNGVNNEDAVSIQDSDDEESSQDRESNTQDKSATVIYVGNNANNTNENGDNSPTVLSDSDEEFEDEQDVVETTQSNNQNNYEDESDIEEVEMWNDSKKPIVVSDAKKLTDLGVTVSGQKEPTVVIINTETSNKNKETPAVSEQTNLQSIYSNIAARGTTVTPVLKQQNSANTTAAVPQSSQNILPSLTDDMFVVEAPSFIVPYVYEKPSVKPFREYVDAMKEELAKSNLETSDEVEVNIDLSSLKDLELAAQKEAASKKRKIKKPKDDDDSWDAMSTDSEDLSDEDRPKTIVIKDKGDDSIDAVIASSLATEQKDKLKLDGSFDSPLGAFFMDIGMNLVQEHVQKDLLKQQKRKLYKENKTSTGNPKQTEAAITSLMKNIESSSKKNEHYKYEMKKCTFCSFQSESILINAHHLETPHMRNNVYKCNFCSFEVKSPHDILFHMEAEHNIRGRLERAPAYHQCVNCPFEDNGKGRLARHLISCAKKFRPDHNLLPPVEWELPAKIPKINRGRPMVTSYTPVLNKTQPIAMKPNQTNILPSSVNAALFRSRGRPLGPAVPPINQRPNIGMPPNMRAGMMFKNNQFLQNFQLLQGGQTTIRPNTSGVAAPKTVHQQPSISITPLPRATHAAPQSAAGLPPHIATSNNKATFVICEICDGYIKDLEQLRNHMMWIHKVKIHPKMIYNRPPLNCQKCQFRFFTDQGLERHLLGSHGLVTSSMQEAANKGKDAGRCPACGRVYQWKLLNHVARDHNMTLKPAHLSYKCTVCAATFGMYKQFENHVYSAHSVVARRVTEKTSKTTESNTNASVSVTAISSSGITKLSSFTPDNILRPLRINDEITIIPQPSRQK